MKAFWLFSLITVVFAQFAPADEANGFRLSVQKTLLERNRDKDAFTAYWDKIDKALGLKVATRNVSLKDLPEGSLEYVVVVKRWGHSPELLESYAGTEKLAPMLKGAETNLVVGKVPLGGYENSGNRKQYADSIEGWQVVVKHEGKETIKMASTSSFEKIAAKAKPGKPPESGEKK